MVEFSSHGGIKASAHPMLDFSGPGVSDARGGWVDSDLTPENSNTFFLHQVAEVIGVGYKSYSIFSDN